VVAFSSKIPSNKSVALFHCCLLNPCYLFGFGSKPQNDEEEVKRKLKAAARKKHKLFCKFLKNIYTDCSRPFLLGQKFLSTFKQLCAIILHISETAVLASCSTRKEKGTNSG